MDSLPIGKKHIINRDNAERLFNYLVNRYKPETASACESMGYSLDELYPQ